MAPHINLALRGSMASQGNIALPQNSLSEGQVLCSQPLPLAS